MLDLGTFFLALRHAPNAALPTVGCYTAAFYLADNGFEAEATAWHWKRNTPPPPLQRRHACRKTADRGKMKLTFPPSFRHTLCPILPIT